MTKFKSSLFYLFLYLLPKNCVSALIGKLVAIQLPSFISRGINRAFAKKFDIDLSEAELPIEQYTSLQEFFVRRLKPGARVISTREDVLFSPCDGVMSVCHKISNGQLIQAKGKLYRLNDLLQDDELALHFVDGYFATIYLSPRDYHRFHSPLNGTIIKTKYIPGALWPVNEWGVTNIDQLFCKNERAISVIAEKHSQKLLAHIAVGATVVGKIDLEYCKLAKDSLTSSYSIAHQPAVVKSADELGKFMFGSTIVLLMQPGLVKDFTKLAPCRVKMGEILGNLH